jgi:excisionase family DNA binding protein
MGSKQDDKLNTGEIARILNVNNNTVRKWADAGLLKAERVGPQRERKFKMAEVSRFLERGSPEHH